MNNNKNTKNQSRKNKSKKTKQLWNIFKDEMGEKSNLELLFQENRVGMREKCELCDCQLRISPEKFLVCSNTKCGIIYKDCLDTSAEWRYYGADDNNSRDPTRCGMPINPLLRESSYACRIMAGYNSSYQMKRIKRYTDWQSMPYKEKAIYDEFQRITTMSKIAGIPKIIIDEALKQHKKISEMKTFRGCNRHGIIAASIYLASRIHNYPRTAKEIAEIFHLDNSSSTKGCKNAVHILNTVENTKNLDEKNRFPQYKTNSIY